MQKNRLKQLKKDFNTGDESIQKGLMKIYSNADGTLPDISHLEVRRRSRLRTIIIAAAGISIILAAAAWAGFLLFGTGRSIASKSIKLAVSGPQSIASGDEVTYVIEYKNIDKVDLHDVEVIVRYPDHFTFASANPAPTNNFSSSWSIGTLTKGQSGTIEVRGTLIGEVGSIQTVNATIQFRPANFSASFKETASADSQITSSILELNIEGPVESLTEKKVQYIVKYQNNSEEDLKNIKVKLQYPGQFVFQEATPPPLTAEDSANAKNNEWLIETLPGQGGGEISINGGFTPNDDSLQATMVAQIGFMGATDDDFSLQQEKTIITKIIKPDLSLNLIINGSNQNQPINFEQELTYSIVYKNLGQHDLSDVSISLTLEGDVVDWKSLVDQHGGRRNGNTIIWNKDQISELDVVRPLTEGTIDLAVKARDGASLGSGTALTLISKATATLPRVGDMTAEALSVDSNEIQNSINTDIQLQSQGRYFDDDNIPVGSGPLPPVVGQKTSFRIYWSLANSLHEVGDVIVTTVLPPGVEWDNKFLAGVGSMSYSSGTKIVTWKIDRIAPNKNFDDTTTWFDVSVTPTKQQVRKLLILADQTTLTAHDKVTDSVISKTSPAITSNLEDDPIGGGKGLVIDINQ